MKLKIRTEQVIDVSDWDALVVSTYGRPYSFQQQDDCRSRGIFRFVVPELRVAICDFDKDTIPEEVNHEERGVSFAAWLARDPAQKLAGLDCQEDYRLKLWWHRNFYPHISMVTNDLYTKGLLPKGSYIIDIDW